MTSPRTRARQVGVFRLQLFKPSETFILNQTAAYSRWKPVFLGRVRHGPGPPGAEAALPKRGVLTSLAPMLTRNPAPYVRSLGGRRPDILHAHFAVDGVYAAPLARRLDIPLVTTLHGFDVSTSDAALLASGRAPLIQAVLWRRRLQARGQLFVAVSSSLREQAVAKGFPAERTRTLPIGIDPQRLAPDGRLPEPGLVAHVGRLVEKKGTAILLRAFSLLAARRPDARLEIVGDGPLRARLEQAVRRLGIGDRVAFHGTLPQAETLEVMRRASVVAVPSVTARSGDCEGLPTVVLEAAALARPVVASHSGGIAEAVEDGATGFTIPERDAGGLAARIGLLLDDPETARAMGAAARRRMQTQFDVRTQTARLEDWYDEMVDRWPAGRTIRS